MVLFEDADPIHYFIIAQDDVARSMPELALAPKGSQGSAKEGKTGRGNRRSFRPIVPSPFGLEERSSRRAEQFKPLAMVPKGSGRLY